MNCDNTEKTRTIAVIVDNEVGVLARVVGLFAGRGYNIDSLTVSEVDCRKHLSRITIVAIGTDMVLEQIKAQLGRLIPVHKVKDMTLDCVSVERELALFKMVCEGEQRVEALRMAEIFKAKVQDATYRSFIFELTGDTNKINAFVKLMEPLGLVDVSRTGVVAIARGDRPI
ncbi:MAG: acetolactate synthase small subunit [Alphaproteobacteria bacterium]|nr:acetolactate synthase small subunit [Alphaproteobacteria bacterium]